MKLPFEVAVSGRTIPNAASNAQARNAELMRIESLLPLIHLLLLRMPREAKKPNCEGEKDLSK